MSTRPIVFADQKVELSSDAALLWPEQRLLVVADLHLGRGLTREVLGHEDAVADDLAVLRRLGRVVHDSGAEKLIILGDFVHETEAVTAAMISMVANWRKTVHAEIILLRSSYDHLSAPVLNRWDMEPFGDSMLIAPLLFCYKPNPERPEPQVCGHLHPCARLSSTADSLKLPCFVVEPNRLLLPSFGSHPDGFEVLDKDDRVFYVISDGEILLI